MARHPDPNPSKAALYQRKWRAKNPAPPSPNKVAKLQIEALWGDKLGVKKNRVEQYREAQKERYRWIAVLKAQKDLIFKDRGQPITYSYADAIFRQNNKPVKAPTPQAEYQRRYRAKRKAELPEAVAVPRILEHLPEELHSVLHNLLDTIRRCPKPEPVPVPTQEPKQEPKQEPETEPTTMEQRHQAVLKAGHDLTFEGEIWFHEDALWAESRK